MSAPTLDDMRQCFEIRRALEPLAAGEAAKRLTEEQLDALNDLVQTMRSVDDVATWVELNDRFHMELYAASANDRLQEIIESLRKSSRYYIQLYVANGVAIHSADDEHQGILDACRDRNVSRARSLTRAHVERTLQGVTLFLTNSPQHPDGAAGADDAFGRKTAANDAAFSAPSLGEPAV